MRSGAPNRISAFFSHRPTRWLLLLIFAVIAFIFIATNIVVLHRLEQVRQATEQIVQDMLASIELVGRMRLDVTRQERLIEDHILENEPDGRARIENEIAQTRADFADAAAAYGPLAEQADERMVWRRLQQRVASIQDSIAQVLQLSAQDQDREARAALLNLDGRFTEISEDADALIRINQTQADMQAQQITTMQRAEATFHTLLISIGVVATLIVGWWTIRLIGQREDELTRYSAMLEARNRDLDAFAGRVAHDLRGPLFTINLAGARLAEQTPGAADGVAILQRGVQRMEALIRDLLALSRIDAEPLGACNPAAVAAQIREELAPRLASERADVVVHVAEASVRCTEGLLRQTLWNLVDNAVKYRRPNSPVRIEVVGIRRGREYELRVSDNGPGLAPDEAERAFEPFYRAPQARKLPGTGLGLSIVKRVVEASGGAVAIDSRVQQGTTFTIRLPLADGNE